MNKRLKKKLKKRLYFETYKSYELYIRHYNKIKKKDLMNTYFDPIIGYDILTYALYISKRLKEINIE